MEWYIKVLRNYAVFTGRARRKEYWNFVLFNFFNSVLTSYMDLTFGTVDQEAGFGYLNLAYSVAVLVPSVAVAVRRMHDVGKSGWYMLIPLYNLVLALTPGEEGPNQYGPDPKAEEMPHEMF